MKKMTTLFKKDPEDLGRVINEINPENEWVFEFGIATRKFDGTSCAIIDGELYKRYDSKINRKTGKRKPILEGVIACQEPDNITGHWPHWVKCDRNNNADKWHFVGYDELFSHMTDVYDGTYELCGEKVQGNPEGIEGHKLIKHGIQIIDLDKDFDFNSIRSLLGVLDIEGIVFHHKNDDRMCKIRKSDFGIKR